jgi:hypothetical protein
MNSNLHKSGGGTSSKQKMPSAAQIRALNETLQLLVIAFGDWQMRLVIVVLNLIRWKS